MKGLLLLSGGIDSPVAGYMMLKKMELEAVYFDNYPFAGKENKQRTIENAKKLGVKLHVIPFGQVLIEYMKNSDKKYQCVYCKRMMLRLAEALARKIKADVLVNGDNLAQVASQTLQNLITVSQATNLPIIRPLIGFDKQEIISIAKQIGTYEISTRSTFCCSAVPKKPSTSCKPEKIKQEESKINIQELINKYLKKEELVN